MKITNILFGAAFWFSVCAVVSTDAAQDGKPPIDRFAEIGAIKSDYSNRNLVDTPPPALVRRLLPMAAEAKTAAFQPAAKLATADELRQELQRQRRRYEPFLKNLAPPLDDARIRVPLEVFDWRSRNRARPGRLRRHLGRQGSMAAGEDSALWRADGQSRHILSHGVRRYAGHARQGRIVRPLSRRRLQGARLCQRGASRLARRIFRPLRVRVYATCQALARMSCW